MRMNRVAVILASGAVAAGGAGVAIAATGGDDAKKRESAVIEDAAKRLNVTPQALRDALGKAEDAQVDQAVKDGKLTQEQADAIKARRAQGGTVLGPGVLGGRRGGPGGHGFGPGFGFGRGALGAVADDVAKALGLTRAQLLEKLRAGTSLADVAKAQGKSTGDVKAAVRKAVADRTAQAVKDGTLTRAQADRITEELDEHLDDLVEHGLRRFGGGPRHGRHGPPSGP